jgi:hypothetical protein
MLGTVKNKFCHFSSPHILCLGCKPISPRAARLLIVLHPEQNIENKLKLKTYKMKNRTTPTKSSCSSGKGQTSTYYIIIGIIQKRPCFKTAVRRPVREFVGMEWF